jgi:hypothetical protein
MRISSAVRGLLAAAAALLVTGCAGVPGRSAVVPASRIEAPRVQPFAVPPSSGDTPDGIVRGFLAAGKDFHQNHQVAREYLDGGGAQWQALAPVVVVDAEPCVRLTAVDGVPVAGSDTAAGAACPGKAPNRADRGAVAAHPHDGQTARVRVIATVHARIDALGTFTLSDPHQRSYQHDFSLVGRRGEWRITNAPPGLVLTSSALNTTFTPLPLYFGERAVQPGEEPAGRGGKERTTGAWLVPDVRWFPTTALERTATASMAVRSLLQGPSDWLADAVTTGAGPGIELAPLAGVQFEGDVARVDLTRAPAQRGLLQAQLLATLQALPFEPGFATVGAVELTVKQVKLDVPAGPVPALWSPPAVVEAPPTAGRRDDPDTVGAGSPLCITGKGEVGQTRFADRASCVARADLAALTKAAPASVPAADLRRSLFAALTQTRDDVYAVQSGQQDAAVVVRGEQLTAPSVDGEGAAGHGWVWAASSVPGGPVLAGGAGRRRKVTVAVPWLGTGRILSLRISPEGTRALLVVQRGTRTEVVVSGVVRAADGTPLRLARGAQSLLPDLTSGLDAGWRDPLQIAVLGARSGSPKTFVWAVRTGGDVSALGSEIPARQAAVGLAVSGASVDTYVRTAAGTALVSSLGGSWKPIDVPAPALPG